MIEVLQTSTEFWTQFNEEVNGTNAALLNAATGVSSTFEEFPALAEASSFMPFKFVGRLEGPNGATQEAGFMTWTSTVTGPEPQMLMIFEAAAVVSGVSVSSNAC